MEINRFEFIKNDWRILFKEVKLYEKEGIS